MSADTACPGFQLDILTKTSLARKRVFFPALAGSSICPLTRITAMRQRSPFQSGPEDPIFVVNGKPLRRKFMMDKSSEALTLAGIPKVGKAGSKMWRAGLATQSVRSGQPQATTQFLGIWASSAYKRYVETDDSDITNAVSDLVRGDIREPPVGGNQRLTGHLATA